MSYHVYIICLYMLCMQCLYVLLCVDTTVFACAGMIRHIYIYIHTYAYTYTYMYNIDIERERDRYRDICM